MTEQEMAYYYFQGAKQSSNISTEIKALDVAIDALEKQIPKKVIFVHPLQEDDCGEYMCPSCKSGTVYDAYGKKSPYCHYCGQAIKWE